MSGARTGISWAGLFAGPGAWAVSTQANYAATPWVCAHKVNFIPVLALVLAAVAFAGAFLSWRAWEAAGGSRASGEASDGRPVVFLAAIGILMGVLFALVILTQGAAALILDGCER